MINDYIKTIMCSKERLNELCESGSQGRKHQTNSQNVN
jgi:hypothetical protein